jgi:ABC-type transport system involved in multi-copper enzyme maturation permease subunit
MAVRWGLGPVFAAECLTASRRWQVYAGRSLVLAGVLAGLCLVWLARDRWGVSTTTQENATLGARFVDAMMAVELALALVVVPAAAAGAVCQDKMRGSLTLMLITDLSDAEIVLGKLASHLVTVLGVIACGLPVLAILTSLGGVDPASILAGSMVIVAVAVLGVSLSLTFSVWATKPHEALMATYATYAIWLLALLTWIETSPVRQAPELLYLTSPFWLLFGARWARASVPFFESLGFLGGILAIASVLATVSALRIRAVTIRQAGRPVRLSAWPFGLALRRFRSERASARLLERDPVLWREKHRRRPAGWGRAIWMLYAGISLIFTALAILNSQIAPGTSAFMVSIGLLMVSVTAATALAEERAHGSLDVLMTTPVSSRAIVVGKWRGAFRGVVWLAVLPGILALSSAASHQPGFFSIIFSTLTVALVVAYGAAVSGLGVFLAAWQPRLGRAIAISVACYLLITVAYPLVMIFATHAGPDDLAFLWPSPFFGIFISMGWIEWHQSHLIGVALTAMFVWVVLISATAYLLLRATVKSFNRFLGRIPDRSIWSPRSSEHWLLGSQTDAERQEPGSPQSRGYGVRVRTTASSRTT